MSNEHVVVPIEIVYAGRSFVPSGAGGGNIDYSQYYTVENGAFTQFDGAGLDKAINGEDEIDGKKMYIGVETRVPVDGVSVVAKKAFEDNPFIRSVRIPEGVTTIGVAAFAGSQLREVTLPDSLLEIGLRGFNACPNLRHVILPKNLKKISSRAFNMCKGLETVRSAPEIGRAHV